MCERSGLWEECGCVRGVWVCEECGCVRGICEECGCMRGVGV